MNKKLLYYRYLLIALLAIGTALFIWYRTVAYQKNEEYKEYTNYISEHIQDEINVAEGKLQEFSKLLQNVDQDYSLFSQQESKYPFYIYKNDELVFWSDFRFVPKSSSLEGDYKVKYAEFPTGKYLIVKQNVLNNIEIYCCIPLTYQYAIENNYLESSINKEIFTHKNIEINNFRLKNSYEIVEKNSKNYLFSVEYLSDTSIVSNTVLYSIIFLVIIGIMSLLIYIFKLVNILVKKNKIYKAFFLLLLSLVGIRLGMLLLNFPFSIIEAPLFDSKYFASSELSPSLGDLLLNILFLSFFSWFLLNHYYKTTFLQWLVKINLVGKYWWGIVPALFSYGVLYYLVYIYTQVFSNAQWQLDITQSISIDLFKICCLLIFILTGGVYFIYNHVFVRLYILSVEKEKRAGKFYAIIVAALFAFLFFNILTKTIHFELLLWHTLSWLLLVRFKLPTNISRLKYSTYLYFLTIAIVCSIIGSYSLFDINKEKVILDKHKFAFQLLHENDVFAEYLLRETADKIEEDKFIYSKLKSFFSSKEVIEQKIRKVLLPSYLEKYDVNISVFDYFGDVSIQNAEYQNFYSARNEYAQDKYKTDYEDVYFLYEKANSPLRRYMVFCELKDQGQVIGYIILELIHKKNSPNSVYPELLVDKKFVLPQQSKNYQYGIYQKNLLQSKGNFNYEKFIKKTELENERLYQDGIVVQGLHHLALKTSDGRVVIVSSDKFSFYAILANFSFLFLVFLFFVVLFLTGYLYYFRYHRVQLNYGTKILIYLNIAFFLPLLVVSVATLSIISRTYRTNQKVSFIKKAEKVSENIISHMEQYHEDNAWESKLENDIAQVADITDTDINLYSKFGTLLYSHHAAIFDQNLLSKKMNPDAYWNIVHTGANECVTSESVGSLKYNAVYIPIKSFTTGDLLGVLSIPFFESKQELNTQLIGVFTTIINIFSIIFILFLGLSYIASRILTKPLDILTQKIRKTTFGDNKLLEWHSNDEIGILVNEYNSMLLKLEESKEILSRSEKESAWREMAKQVAHEIKNPLTPMKLKIQHLMRSRKEQTEQTEEQLQKGLTTLLEQVNILSEIASSFSAFAKMPIPKSEVFDLSKVLSNTIELYNNTHDVFVDSVIKDTETTVKGDKQLMSAIFTNLIINAIQSVPYNRKPIVEVVLTSDSDMVKVEIRDNGAGIADMIREKVFLPNFTTKETGSGIGLAVAKRGVEHAGGKIWFETRLNEGTSFFIEIPIVH